MVHQVQASYTWISPVKQPNFVGHACSTSGTDTRLPRLMLQRLLNLIPKLLQSTADPLAGNGTG